MKALQHLQPRLLARLLRLSDLLFVEVGGDGDHRLRHAALGVVLEGAEDLRVHVHGRERHLAVIGSGDTVEGLAVVALHNVEGPVVEIHADVSVVHFAADDTLRLINFVFRVCLEDVLGTRTLCEFQTVRSTRRVHHDSGRGNGQPIRSRDDSRMVVGIRINLGVGRTEINTNGLERRRHCSAKKE